MKLPQISTPDALKAKPHLGSLRLPDLKSLKLPDLKSLKVGDVMNFNFARPGGAVVGLDIQPGFVAAAQGARERLYPGRQGCHHVARPGHPAPR